MLVFLLINASCVSNEESTTPLITFIIPGEAIINYDPGYAIISDNSGGLIMYQKLEVGGTVSLAIPDGYEDSTFQLTILESEVLGNKPSYTLQTYTQVPFGKVWTYPDVTQKNKKFNSEAVVSFKNFEKEASYTYQKRPNYSFNEVGSSQKSTNFKDRITSENTVIKVPVNDNQKVVMLVKVEKNDSIGYISAFIEPNQHTTIDLQKGVSFVKRKALILPLECEAGVSITGYFGENDPFENFNISDQYSFYKDSIVFSYPLDIFDGLNGYFTLFSDSTYYVSYLENIQNKVPDSFPFLKTDFKIGKNSDKSIYYNFEDRNFELIQGVWSNYGMKDTSCDIQWEVFAPSSEREVILPQLPDMLIGQFSGLEVSSSLPYVKTTLYNYGFSYSTFIKILFEEHVIDFVRSNAMTSATHYHNAAYFTYEFEEGPFFIMQEAPLR